MGPLEQSPLEKRFWIYLFLAGLIAGLILRFYLASFARMPATVIQRFIIRSPKILLRVEARSLITLSISSVGCCRCHITQAISGIPSHIPDRYPDDLLRQDDLKCTDRADYCRDCTGCGWIPGWQGSLAFHCNWRASWHSDFFLRFQVWFSVTTEAIIFAALLARSGYISP